ncbi:helix-turn-helix transcriptional regulator [Streptomyces abyssomicinicus]|uniref:helix-turn-helix transcriptional regulator n=1 Tax=Streptomyces abyssomicinicus TaxID=574929 RepID=UPI001FE61975|nr:helix-turn-helix transcriptional regulator [Streptomyces abyssomicinicus]
MPREGTRAAVGGDAAAAAALRAALTRLSRGSGLPVVFGGLVESARPRIRISELSGTRTSALRSLAVSSGTGLGGRAAVLLRPCAVSDYAASRRISHEYDAAVAQEGLRSVLAVPVVVRHRVRGVLYGALRTAEPLGDRALGAAVEAARQAARGLVTAEAAAEAAVAAREEAWRKQAWREETWRPGPPEPPREPTGAPLRERARDAYAALRALAPQVTDPAVRAGLDEVCALLGPSPADAASAPPAVLTPRELDVLACVATGDSNAAAARRLGLRQETVKAYLGSASRKLGARGRWAAVTAARRSGLLP